MISLKLHKPRKLKKKKKPSKKPQFVEVGGDQDSLQAISLGKNRGYCYACGGRLCFVYWFCSET